MISVAAELAEMHPQTLRMYEARGLIEPKRSPKGTRLYSQEDVERLRRIQEMTTEFGLNLAGVERVLELEAQARARAGARSRRSSAAPSSSRPRSRPRSAATSCARISSRTRPAARTSCAAKDIEFGQFGRARQVAAGRLRTRWTFVRLRSRAV